jgi:hypothetical protein
MINEREMSTKYTRFTLGKPSRGKTLEDLLNIDSTTKNNASLQEIANKAKDPSQTLQ